MKCLPLVLVAAALTLTSCSQAGKERPKLGLAMHSFDDSVSVAIRRSIETAALDKADLAIIDGQNQQSAQDMQVDSFFERKLGALAVDPVDGGALGPMIGKAKASRTPIVFFDRKPSDVAMRSWDKLFFVGTQAAEAGAAQGEMLAAYIKADPSVDKNKDGILQFASLDGDRGGLGSEPLADGFVKAMVAAGLKAEQLPSVPRGASAKETSSALIARYGAKIEAVICGDDDAALRSIEAFKAAGYFKAKKTVPILCNGEGDLSPAVAEALTAGTLLGAAYEDAGNQGKAIFDLTLALAKGADPSKAGWRVTDAKYVWIPYMKYPGSALTAPRKK